MKSEQFVIQFPRPPSLLNIVDKERNDKAQSSKRHCSGKDEAPEEPQHDAETIPIESTIISRYIYYNYSCNNRYYELAF